MEEERPFALRCAPRTSQTSGAQRAKRKSSALFECECTALRAAIVRRAARYVYRDERFSARRPTEVAR